MRRILKLKNCERVCRVMFQTALANVSISIKAIGVENLHKHLLISWQDLIKLKVIPANFPAQIEDTALHVTTDEIETGLL